MFLCVHPRELELSVRVFRNEQHRALFSDFNPIHRFQAADDPFYTQTDSSISINGPQSKFQHQRLDAEKAAPA